MYLSKPLFNTVHVNCNGADRVQYSIPCMVCSTVYMYTVIVKFIFENLFIIHTHTLSYVLHNSHLCSCDFFFRSKLSFLDRSLVANQIQQVL